MSIFVLALGLVVTSAMCTASRLNYLHNERRVLDTQTQLVAAALAVGPVDVQRRLGKATTLVSATGDLPLFEGAMKSSMPTPFDAVRLFEMVDGRPKLVDSMGAATMLRPGSPQARALVLRAVKKRSLVLARQATPTKQRYGYAVSATTLGRTYVAYAEQAMSGDRRMPVPSDSPLSNMVYAMYTGPTESPAALTETNADHLPLGSSASRATVPFGDTVLTVVLKPRSSLLGSRAPMVAWIILGLGLLLTIIMTVLTERLQRRRAVAELLAEVSSELARTQQGVAETLQNALLPHHLPQRTSLAIATRYVAGTQGIDVGGDWYDVVELPRNRVFFTIGDVSGRGLSAATMMSRLRHSITAYALEGDEPEAVLAKVSGLIDFLRDDHFATALCGILDLCTGEVTVANAGHPPLILLAEGTATAVDLPVWPPLGIGGEYAATTLTLAPGSVLLGYTDGLVERRDRPADVGIAQLCSVALAHTGGLEDLLDCVLARLTPGRAALDDVAILGLRWDPV